MVMLGTFARPFLPMKWETFRDKYAIPYFKEVGAWFCWRCGKRDDTLILDHIENRGMGGNPDKNCWHNLQVLCFWCHNKKTEGKA